LSYKPSALKIGDTIGVFTPYFPAHVEWRDKYLHGLAVLRNLGYEVLEGALTAKATSQGYRSGSPQERAAEFMELYRQPQVKAMISTIGGTNSSSLIPYLEFDFIAAHPKIICGYSDVTSLHLALLKFSKLRTFYGPAVMPSFGEWPDVLPETKESFLRAVSDPSQSSRPLTPPASWSNHLRGVQSGEWKTLPRRFEKNLGWKTLIPGKAEAPVLVANLNTLLTAAGTSYFPDLTAKILLIEQMKAAFSMDERNLRQLERMGVFDRIAGLIVGKPEFLDSENAPFSHDELLLEVVGQNRPYPVVSGFDCSHTNPMLTIAQMTQLLVEAKGGYETRVTVLESMVI
jgi:muramoyltetrapeptide carboxypeptidase LdcA involved in peptidoglycan recycling